MATDDMKAVLEIYIMPQLLICYLSQCIETFNQRHKPDSAAILSQVCQNYQLTLSKYLPATLIIYRLIKSYRRLLSTVPQSLWDLHIICHLCHSCRPSTTGGESTLKTLPPRRNKLLLGHCQRSTTGL